MLKKVPLAHWLTCSVLVLLAASTVSTKSAGAFWLSLTVIGIVHWLKKPQPGVWVQPHAADNNLQYIAKGWLIFCGLALALKSVPMVYWSGPWQERHAEFRLLIGAIGSYLLLRHQRLPKAWHEGVGHALALACLLALVLTAVWGI